MMNFIKGGRIHAYLKGIIQSIYTIKSKYNKHWVAHKYADAKNAFKNNVAHATTRFCKLSSEMEKEKISKRINSDFFLTNLTPTSKFLRLGFDLASGFHRLQCMKSRRIVEQKASGSRKRGQDREKKVNSNLLDVANSKLRHCLGGTRYIPAFNPLRTLFYLRPSLHRMCTVLLPSLHQEKDGAHTVQVWCSYGETYYKDKRRLKESPNKIRTDGFAFFMIFMKNVLAKIVVNVQSLYGLFTNALLKLYQKGTANVLESYQRATEVSSLAVLGLACARQVWKFSFPCVAQASVMRMLSTGKAWIVRKKVPVYALLTHYQRFIYASSILDPYTESALSQIRGFKRSNFFCQASEWFCINNLSNRLKYFSNQVQGGVRDMVNEGFVKLSLKSTFSIALILLSMMMFGSVSAQAQNKQNYVLQETVISDVDKKPLQAVSVRVESDNVKTSTKKDGSFSIAVSQRTGKVKFTSVGYKSLELDYTAVTILHVQLIAIENQLEEVEVVSTGYQKIPKERATGSFEVINKEQLNISKSTNIINRLEGLSSSLRFDKRVEGLSPIEQLSVRTTSTYFGYNSPLVILDNFPYEGDISNINPNDIESVTILKDAAAASIWGTRAGNGVIVLTSKKSDKDGKMKLSVQIANQIGEKPDLYKKPYMSSSSFMEMEELLFDQKFYDWQINAPDRVVSPLVLLLDQLRRGDIDSEMYEKQKNNWSKNDVRTDYLKYIYRNSYNQQYAANVLGGSSKFDFQASVGYDKNKNTLQKSSLERMTARLVSNIRPHQDLEINMQLMYGNSTTKGLGTDSQISFGSLYSGAGRSYYPYLRLVDDEGNAIDLETVTIRKSYIDTLVSGRLLPAHYNIFNEFESSEKKNTTEDITLNIGANWKITSFLSGSVAYQFQKSNNKITNWQGADSYFTQHNLFL